MSTKMLNATASDSPYHQGVLDDIEAFVNVAFWAALFNLNFPSKSTDEEVWREKLRSSSHHVRDGAQNDIIDVEGDEKSSEGSDDPFAELLFETQALKEKQAPKTASTEQDVSELLKVFRPVLRDWRKALADRSSKYNNPNARNDLTEQILALLLVSDFAEVLLKHRQTLMQVQETGEERQLPSA